MVFTVLANIVLCPFSHILAKTNTSFYVLVQDVSKSATLPDIAKHNYVLTPGRYVGIPDEVEDPVSFEERMQELTIDLLRKYQPIACCDDKYS